MFSGQEWSTRLDLAYFLLVNSFIPWNTSSMSDICRGNRVSMIRSASRGERGLVDVVTTISRHEMLSLAFSLADNFWFYRSTLLVEAEMDRLVASRAPAANGRCS